MTTSTSITARVMYTVKRVQLLSHLGSLVQRSDSHECSNGNQHLTNSHHGEFCQEFAAEFTLAALCRGVTALSAAVATSTL